MVRARCRCLKTCWACVTDDWLLLLLLLLLRSEAVVALDVCSRLLLRELFALLEPELWLWVPVCVLALLKLLLRVGVALVWRISASDAPGGMKPALSSSERPLAGKNNVVRGRGGKVCLPWRVMMRERRCVEGSCRRRLTQQW